MTGERGRAWSFAISFRDKFNLISGEIGVIFSLPSMMRLAIHSWAILWRTEDVWVLTSV